MENLVLVNNDRVVTTSRKVAEYFGKEHKHVLRDIKQLECGSEFSQSNFGLSEYTSDRGRTYEEYLMTKRGFTILTMGFTGKRAMEFKLEYMNQFERMEEELRNNKLQLNMPSYMIEDKRSRALKWIEELEEKRDLEIKLIETKELKKVADEYIEKNKTKVELYNDIAIDDTCYDFQEASAMLGYKDMGRNKLFELLKNEKILTKKNIPARQYIERGYFKTTEKRFTNDDCDKIITKTFITIKGLNHINRLLKKMQFEKVEMNIQ